MPTLTVTVSSDDIDQGHRRNTWTCPICLALWRATGVKWSVDETTCYPLTNRNAFIPLPPEVITFIAEFDATGCGQPFVFQIEVPEGMSESNNVFLPIAQVPTDLSIPFGARCQEASVFSRESYIPCGAPAVAIVDNGDSRPYYMCEGCADHNVRNRGARVVSRKSA